MGRPTPSLHLLQPPHSACAHSCPETPTSLLLLFIVRQVDATGQVVPMTEAREKELLEEVTAMASRGLRTLCLSYRGER